MLSKIPFRLCLIAVLLALVATSSQALTLGRTRGVVLIGQPLNLDVLLTLSPGESISALCLEADVFHADTMLPATRVSVTASAGASAQQGLLKIRSQVAVDEPFVMLFVRAGCTEKVTRRYVLLADVASESSPPGVTVFPTVVPFSPPPQGPLPTVTIPPPFNVGTASIPSRSNSRTRQKSKRALPLAPVPELGAVAPTPLAPESLTVTAAPAAPNAEPARKSKRAESALRAAPIIKATEPAPLAAAESNASSKPTPSLSTNGKVPGPSKKARLVIDPVELLTEVDPVLKPSAEILSVPTDNPQQRAASAALWRALNTQPLDLLRDLERVERLQAEANTVRSQNLQQQERIGMLSSQLEKAREERYSNPLVYLLLALSALAVFGSAFFWWRHRRTARAEPAWWLAQKNSLAHEEAWSHSKSAKPSVQPAFAPPVSVAPAPFALADMPVLPMPTAAALDIDLDFDLSAPLSKPAAKLVPAAPPVTASATTPYKPLKSTARSSSGPISDFSNSQLARAVNAEELFDVQQQADFFITLGQHDQAITVLKDHIKENVQTSALAYLDLFEIYHRLDRKVDYSLLRDEFHKVFNAQAPKFDDFGTKTRGLESYFVAMARIQALWPALGVLEVIEESVFRKPDDEDGEVFDLEAYRDLILLRTLVKNIANYGATLTGPEAIPGYVPSTKPASRSALNMAASVTTPGFLTTDVDPWSDPVLEPVVQSLIESEAFGDLHKPPASMRLGLDFDLSRFDSKPPPSQNASAELPRAAGQNQDTDFGDGLLDFDLKSP
ncbi:MAG: hypothetical protein ACKVOO_10680 [Burkholderiaceae bacterium]